MCHAALGRRATVAVVDAVTRGWAVVTSAGVVRLGLGFVASLIVARALGPADFGIYAVFAATVGIVGTIAEGGLTEAAVLRMSAAATDRPSRARRAAAFFWLRIGLAGVVVALGCALAPLISRYALNGIDEGLLRWALLGIAATAASGGTSAMLQARGEFGRMSSLTLLNTGLTVVFAAGLAAVGRLDLTSALVILGIGTSLLTFGAGRLMLPRGLRLGLPSRSELQREVHELTRTGRWLWLASLFAILTANAEVLLLNRFLPLATVGVYALALNLASKADVANQSLYTVLLPGVGSLDVRTSITAYLKRGALRSLTISAGLLLLIPLAPYVVVLVYGDAFAQSATFLQLLLGIAILDVLLTPFLLLPLAFRRPKLLAAADAARAIVLVGVALGFVPAYGAFGAILARLAARIGGAAVVQGGLLSARPALQVQDKEAAGILE